MALKRKRSSPALSSSPCSTDTSSTYAVFDGSTTKTMPSFYVQSEPIDTFYNYKPTWSFPTYDDHIQHLNSRTRKRHRDNRPDEEEVFASTITKLFQAQKQHPDSEPIVSHQPQDPVTKPQNQRSTLHSFWKLPNLPSHQSMQVDTADSSMAVSKPTCNDCDRNLQEPDAMELDDEALIQESACHSCGRSVCQLCAIAAERRVCLACAACNG